MATQILWKSVALSAGSDSVWVWQQAFHLHDNMWEPEKERHSHGSSPGSGGYDGPGNWTALPHSPCHSSQDRRTAWARSHGSAQTHCASAGQQNTDSSISINTLHIRPTQHPTIMVCVLWHKLNEMTHSFSMGAEQQVPIEDFWIDKEVKQVYIVTLLHVWWKYEEVHIHI